MTKDETFFIRCPFCHAEFKRRKVAEKERPLVFCAYCGSRFQSQKTNISSPLQTLEPPPNPSEVQSTIGKYQILQSIGKGGMGEVFLAYDTSCGRRLALKRIRTDLAEFPQLQKRFLREARITAQITHPAIIPIYSIDVENGLIYYSMPFVEGDTLKQIIRRAKEHEKHAHRKSDPHGSIPVLIRHFLQVCQAIAYAHSKGVLHRDIKPENIIVGRYGQVMILDWGLAKVLGDDDESIEIPEEVEYHTDRITRIGKVVGTISHMAPERAEGKKASIQTDIYSLGVMLYQLLTLQLPFKRKNLAGFKKQLKKEQLVTPETCAPYRDVPQVLSEVVKRCLACDPEERYSSVDQLIVSLENYLEGKSEWVKVKELDINNKEDWLFQENVLLAEHTAITRSAESAEWVSLMISQEGFRDNMKLEVTVRIGKTGQGIGLLFCVPESMERSHQAAGYSLWLASEASTAFRSTRLHLSTVSVLEAPEVVLKSGITQVVRIEKVDDRISVFLNDHLQFSFVSHIPVEGSHVGLLARDADFDLESIEVFVGSQNINVNCLAVPDAFLASKMYDKALQEYRRIGDTFMGRQEGREALFRAGITRLEQAKDPRYSQDQKYYLDEALAEFGKLRLTPGAPLEYLGKSFVYSTLAEYEEEAKCFELALRRYKHHPLLPIIEEQIIFRMYESSHQNRIAAYHFICLVSRFLTEWAERPQASKIFASLQKSWEVPFFFLHSSQHLNQEPDAELKRLSMSLGMGFWLAKPYIIAETLEEIMLRPIVAILYLADAIFLLVELGSTEHALEKLLRMKQILSISEQERYAKSLEILDVLIRANDNLAVGVDWLRRHNESCLSKEEERLVWYLLRHAINSDNEASAQSIKEWLLTTPYDTPNPEIIDALLVETLIYQRDLKQIEKILSKYPQGRLTQESCPLYFVYGCYLALTEGVTSALSFFGKLLDIAFPRSWVLGAHFLAGKIHMTPAGWFARSFRYERIALYEQLRLFWHASADIEKSSYWKNQLMKEENRG